MESVKLFLSPDLALIEIPVAIHTIHTIILF